MATNKTIQPTNVTVQIPAMTDAPDMSVPANAIDKAIDGINALNSQMAKSAFLSWGTSLTANNFHHGLLMITRLLFVVWFASSADINVKGMTTPQFSKSGQNSVTFGDTSDTGTDYTITRNGTTITVTSTGNATISLLYV